MTVLVDVNEIQSDPAELPLERVEAELCTLAGQIAAATCRFLRLLADFDAREGWAGWQVRSCAQWLSWRCGMDLRTAREQVRVARALAGLPRTSEAFAQGRLSYSKVRALSRVATAHTEADLVETALQAPAAQVERLCRGVQTAKESGPREVKTGVQWRWDDDGCLVIWGRLAADEGARLLAGLTRLEHERTATVGSADGATGDTAPAPDDGPAEPPRSPRVDGGAPADLGPALVAAGELACATADAPISSPAADVVVHVDVERFVDAARRTCPGVDAVPAGEADGADADAGRADADAGAIAPSLGDAGPTAPDVEPAGRLEDGPGLTAAVVLMLACDGRLQLSVDGPDGRTLDLGRRRRRPTMRQLTALWRRDRGCAVPGCGRVRFLHAHHVVPWALGGATSLDNLVLLCGGHHRRLHNGGFAVQALGKQRFRFRGTAGQTVAPAPDIAGAADELATAYSDVSPTTIEPDWDGSGLQLDQAVANLLGAWTTTMPD